MSQIAINNNCVYLHFRETDNIIFYVGIGNLKRPYSKINRNKHWYNTVNKYGYYVVICETNLSWEEACDKEINLIKIIGRRDLGLGTLVNYTNGGDGINGMIYSIVSKRKMSVSATGRKASIETKLKIGNIVRGRKYTKETKDKISKSHKGIKLGNKQLTEHINKRVIKNKKAIIQMDLQNNFIKEWLSAIDTEKFGFNSSLICACCKGRKKSHKGFKWKYKNDH